MTEIRDCWRRDLSLLSPSKAVAPVMPCAC